MQKSEIQDLIEKGNIRLLLESLSAESKDKDDRNTYTLLLSRFNKNEREGNMGILDKRDYDKEYNKIIRSILLQNNIEELPIQQQNKNQNASNMTTKQKLSDLSVSLKRKNPALHQECELVLSKYKEYEDNKRLQPTFDIVGRSYILNTKPFATM